MDEEFIFALIVMGFAVWLLTPVVRALAERIRSGERRPVRGFHDEVERVRDDLTEDIVALRREVADLTERVEFAERLLAKQRDPERLPRGG